MIARVIEKYLFPFSTGLNTLFSAMGLTFFYICLYDFYLFFILVLVWYRAVPLCPGSCYAHNDPLCMWALLRAGLDCLPDDPQNVSWFVTRDGTTGGSSGGANKRLPTRINRLSKKEGREEKCMHTLKQAHAQMYKWTDTHTRKCIRKQRHKRVDT